MRKRAAPSSLSKRQPRVRDRVGVANLLEKGDDARFVGVGVSNDVVPTLLFAIYAELERGDDDSRRLGDAFERDVSPRIDESRRLGERLSGARLDV